MTIIRYTNPTELHRGKSDPEWRCAACRGVWSSEDEARQCAVRDHERADAERQAGDSG